MRIPSLRPFRFGLVITLAAGCAFVPNLRAQWGSLRASNGPALRRYQNFEAERRYAYYRAGFSPGMVVRRLPAGYEQTSAGTTGYYYYNGVYFRPTTDGTYEVVPPPLGATVPQLPDGAEMYELGSTTYCYAGGAFYAQVPAGFAVVPAPPGLTVAGLPPGAAPVVMNGVMYYVAGANYFIPVTQAGETAYVTAQAPKP